MHLATATAIAALIAISSAIQCNIGSGNAQTNDARTCADLLKGKGSQSCAVDPHAGGYPPEMCHQGTARVYGLSNSGNAESASCQSVGEAVDAIIDACLNGNSGSGADNDSENGNLQIQLHG